jgi:hypothetical protein
MTKYERLSIKNIKQFGEGESAWLLILIQGVEWKAVELCEVNMYKF